VVVLRGDRTAPEILMVRRTRKASFMADAFVFPGGRVESTDGDGEAAFAVAAARELAEEANVHVDASALVPFARWITPSAEPKRFDTHFFVVVAPADAEPRVDATEVTEHLWATAAEILSSHDAGRLLLAPPTLHTLSALRPHGSIREVMTWAQSQERVPIQPKLVAGDELTILLPWDPRYAAAEGEGVVVNGEGASAYVLRDGRFAISS
jgi:8-oxo-dGTP pyrophosphatase MutT (NUDIX family)